MLYNYIEQNKEEMNNQDSQQGGNPIHSNQQDCYMPNSASNSKIKKIRKRHKRKNYRAMKNDKNKIIKPIASFQNHHPEYFNQSGHQYLSKVAKMFETSYHIKQMLSNSIQSIFDIKLKTQAQKQVVNYIMFIKRSENSTYLKYGISNRMKQLSYEVFRDEGTLVSKKQALFQTDVYLESFQSMLREKRLSVMEQITSYIDKIAAQMSLPVKKIPQIHLQLLTLCKLNKRLENEISETIRANLSKQDSLFNCHKSSQNKREIRIKNKYVQILVINNLERSFSEIPIDFYNYHKEIENYQKNQFQTPQFERILNFTQFKRYMESRKPILKRSEIYQLKTACSACFSNYSQMYNPIQKCPECPIRIHKYCQKVQNRCHRCKFSRTSNEEKSQTGFCYICSRSRQKGLMIQTVTNSSPHQFAHNFCLFLHNLWRVESLEIKGTYQKPRQPKQQCAICKKIAGILLVCSNCQMKMHGMCAFLCGCSFKIVRLSQQNAKQYNIAVDCCIEPCKRQRLAMQRKFKLCFQKIIFRENQELYNFIQKQYPQQFKK